MQLESEYIFGIHEAGGEDNIINAGKTGWILFTEAIGFNSSDMSGKDYREYADKGLTVLVRLNNAYNPGGTIPIPQNYESFAKRCSNFVRASKGCTHWIIGNEPNHQVEWPHDNPIIPEMYARCFSLCRNAIHNTPNHTMDIVSVAAIAPWNNTVQYHGNENGDWVVYFGDVLDLLGKDGLDGITLHTYTHGPEKQKVTDNVKMNPPFAYMNYNFRSYQNFMSAIPDEMLRLPVYITETDQNDAWVNVNSGWIQAAYKDIDEWNASEYNTKIHALILYRWPKIDKYFIDGKQGVIDDFKMAIINDYRWTKYSFSVPQEEKSFDLYDLVDVKEYLNVRQSPGLSSDVLNVLPRDTNALVYEGPEEADGLTWWKVRAYGVNGRKVQGWAARSVNDITLLSYIEKEHILLLPFKENWPITQSFGVNPRAYRRVMIAGVYLLGHNGIDYGIPLGTYITAAAEGVVEVVTETTTGYGTYVKTRHSFGNTLYGHLTKFLVSKGQYVRQGQVIGISGNTGNSTGPHLHFGLQVNDYIRSDGWGGYTNPTNYLRKR